MESTVLFISVIITFTLLAFGWQVWCSQEHKDKKKGYLVASVLLMIATLALECILLRMDGKTDNHTLYRILLAAESMIASWIVPTQIHLFDCPKAGKIFSIIAAAYSVFLIAAAPWDLVFSVSEAGEFMRGPLYELAVVWGDLSAIALPLMLLKLARQKDRKGEIALWLIAVLEVMGVVFCIISGNEIVKFLTYTLAFLLVYFFHEDQVERMMYEELKESHNRNEELTLQTVRALVNSLDAKDKYTNGHSQRVSDYAVMLAKKLGWSEKQIYQLRYDGLIHDVGKIGIPDSVLNKQGRLTDAEFDIIKSHTIFGSDILKDMDAVTGAYDAARWHHERYDGKGYPDRKSGNDIPESARIISIADTFDAMNSDRIYRRALPKEVIIRELEKGKGTQFDPELTDRFIELYENGDLDEIAAAGRRDAEKNVDEVTEEIRDFFEMFDVAYETLGERGENFTQTETMRKYLLGMAGRHETNIEVAIVTVTPKAELEMSDEEMDMAANVMITAIDNSIPELMASGRVSKTQIVTIRRVVDGPDLASFLQLAFVYYYKIYKAERVDISFDILEKGK